MLPAVTPHGAAISQVAILTLRLYLPGTRPHRRSSISVFGVRCSNSVTSSYNFHRVHIFAGQNCLIRGTGRGNRIVTKTEKMPATLELCCRHHQAVSAELYALCIRLDGTTRPALWTCFCQLRRFTRRKHLRLPRQLQALGSAACLLLRSGPSAGCERVTCKPEAACPVLRGHHKGGID